jgi:uncharacterized hydrophobic protein (TIGR00271 family)
VGPSRRAGDRGFRRASRARDTTGAHTRLVDLGVRRLILPQNQRRTLEELTEDLDLRSGDRRAKQTAFWTMLVLSALIATAGVLSDSTATVIGAMIIAPLSTPIMGIALGIVKRERLRAGRFVVFGVLAVILIGYLFTYLVPGNIDLEGNAQITGRTSPGLLDMVAAIATGLAGAVGLSRRDVAAVLPGVAIAISLVPPLAVVGVCLGEGDAGRALGALLLFLSNLVALVIAGTVLFAALGYSAEANERLTRRVGAGVKGYLALGSLLVVVLLPLAANTGFVYLIHWYAAKIESAGHRWIAVVPGGQVTGVDASASGFVVNVRSPQEPPPVRRLMDDLAGEVPPFLPVTVDVTIGREIDAGVVPEAPTPGG